MKQLFFSLMSVIATAPICSQSPRTTTIHGVVYDSLLMAPASGALVWVIGSSQSAVADANGSFTIANVHEGKQFIAFSSASLDSLDLGTLGADVEIKMNEAGRIKLATPSFARIWQVLCRDVGKNAIDSGIVWGTVRDAITDQRLSGARASFNWVDLRVENKQVRESLAEQQAKTDSTATYYSCGLPTDVIINSRADGSHASSGTTQFTIGDRRMRRLDLLVSSEIVERTVSSLSNIPASPTRVHGSATVRGTVLDERNHPIPNAEVFFVATDSIVRADSKGQFAITSLPTGTQDIEFASIGYAPTRKLVELRAETTTDVLVTLLTSQTLAAVTVHAVDKHANVDRLDFETRKKAGFGYLFDEKDLAKAMNLGAILSAVPNATVTRRPGGSYGISMHRISMSGNPSGECSPLVWVDGRRSDSDYVSHLAMSDLRGIEVYTHAGSAPATYVGFQACGVVLYWTKFARW